MAISPRRQQVLQTELDRFGASLSGHERLWASGYLAGLAAAGQTDLTADARPTGQADVAASLTIWYGSETGNGRAVAKRLAAAAEARGHAVELASLDEIQPRHVSRLSLLVLIVSTHGEGDPPEQAEAFYRLMTSERAPKLDKLSYAVFALGDSSYPDFCQTGRELDQALERAGARRILDRVDCDVDFETSEQGWQPRLLETVRPLLEADGATGPRLTVVREAADAAATGITHDRRNPYAAEVLEVSPLTVAPSAKSVHHVVLDIDDSGLNYQPGDSLGVWPENDPRLIAEILETTGLDAASEVERDGDRLPLGQWLARRLELTQVVRPFIARYAELGGIHELNELLADRERFARWCRTRQVADVLAEYPVELDADQLVGSLRALAPRLYSIASSPLADPGEVHLTVKLEGGERDGRLRAGVASRQLTGRLEPGDTVNVYLEANPRFRLPDNGDSPIIMIGPGTGVAPFRAFVAQRQALGHAGPSWLFFGEQHRRTDFLYQLEWQRHLREGALTRLSAAFSRDQAEKCYVQHRLAEQQREVYDWLERGAHVYVCGSGQGMARDVHQALVEVIASVGGLGTEAAENRLAELKSAGRYARDVY